MVSMKFDGYKEGALLERKYFTGNMHLLTTNHSFMTCGDLMTFISTTILGNVVEILALGAGTLHPENS